MKALSRLLVFTIVFLSVDQLRASEPCVPRSQKLTTLVDHLRRATSSSWLDYKAADQNYVLFDSASKDRCAWVKNGAKASYETYVEIQPIRNGVYAFCGARMGDMCAVQFGFTSEASVLIYNVTNVIDQLTPPGFNAIDIHLNTILHEGFHLFVQFGGDRSLWPPFGIGSDEVGRQVTTEQCYGSNPNALKEEAISLRSAYVRLTENDRFGALESLANFFALRSKRRSEVSSVEVTINGEIYSCEVAEQRAELSEGTAQYFGDAAMLDMKVWRPGNIVHQFDHSIQAGDFAGDPSYLFGSTQLLIARELLRLDFDEKYLTAIVRSQILLGLETQLTIVAQPSAHARPVRAAETTGL